MMLSTLLSPRGRVMKPQVRCTTVRLVRDDKSIQYIQEHHDDGGVIQTTSGTPTNIFPEERPAVKESPLDIHQRFYDAQFVRYCRNTSCSTQGTNKLEASWRLQAKSATADSYIYYLPK